MQPSKPNDCGVLEVGCREVIARRGRAYGLYRRGVDMMYALGGFSRPVSIDAPGYPTLDTARTAALGRLLRSWHTPFPSEPESVRLELAEMRQEIASRHQQPSLF